MPLDETRCDKILAIMGGTSVEDKLKAINDARQMFKESFTEGMSDKDYAYSAHVIETLYNLIREELRVSQIRVKQAKESGNSPTSKKVPSKLGSKQSAKPAKKKLTLDFSEMMAEFKKEKANG